MCVVNSNGIRYNTLSLVSHVHPSKSNSQGLLIIIIFAISWLYTEGIAIILCNLVIFIMFCCDSIASPLIADTSVSSFFFRSFQ